MAQTAEARLKLPELNTFLNQLRTRWSPEACSLLCTLEPGSNDSAARAIFDEEFAALRRVSLEVQHTLRTIFAYVGTQRNRFCKINNLPAEILREIFLSACERGLRWRDLASILKTCKQWYHVLSRDPSAYSTINIGDRGCSLRLAKAFAKRSIPLPLSIAWVNVGKGTGVSNSVWEAAFCETRLSRIKSLEFVHWHLAADKWLLESPAPELERCKLSLRASEDEDWSDYKPSPYFYDPEEHIFPHLFGGNAPKLRALEFFQVRLAWCPGNYRDLTHVKITFHPELLANTERDIDDVTILFRESPRLEHVELITSGDEDRWQPTSDDVPEPDHARPKCIMRHLHTLRLHLFVLPLIGILGAIEITPTIRTIDIRSDNDSDSGTNCLEILDVGVLPDFLFAELRYLFIGNLPSDSGGHIELGLMGSGSLHQHRYSLRVCLLRTDPIELGEAVALGRHMPELRRIAVSERLPKVLVEILAVSPAVSAVDVIGYDHLRAASRIQHISSDPQSRQLLARISHWAFIGGSEHYTLYTDDMDALKALFQLLPSKRRTLFIDGKIQLRRMSLSSGEDILRMGEDYLRALRAFVVDLARLGVVIVEPVKFDFGWDSELDDDRIYTSVVALWTSSGDEVPEVVQEVIKDGYEARVEFFPSQSLR